MKPLGVIPFSSAIPSQYFLSESGSFTDTASVFLASISGSFAHVALKNALNLLSVRVGKIVLLLSDQAADDRLRNTRLFGDLRLSHSGANK